MDKNAKIDLKIEQLFVEKYKQKLESGEITEEQFQNVCELIENRKELTEKEFNQRLIKIFPESEDKLRQVMG